jgi:predicted nucleic acid-binding protein
MSIAVLPSPPLYLLDTNILVHYVRASDLYRRVETIYSLTAISTRVLCSIINEGEIRSLARRWNWGAARLLVLEALLARLTRVPLEYAGIVDAYADMDDYLRRRGQALSKNDIWIAATARATGARLLTTDRDFDPLTPAFLARDWIDPVTTL